MFGGRRAVRLGGRRAEPHRSGLERWWFVAFCDVLVVESAFGFDSSLTVCSRVFLRRAIVRPRLGPTAVTAGVLTGAVGLHSVGNSSRLPGWVVWVCRPGAVQMMVPSGSC